MTKLTITVHGKSGQAAREAAVSFLAEYGAAPVGPVRSRGPMVFLETASGFWEGEGAGPGLSWRRQRRNGSRRS